jgi:plasmid stability protein
MMRSSASCSAGQPATGRSLEEEIRDILRDAVKDDGHGRGGFGTESAKLFRGIGLEEPIREFRIDLKIPKFG